MVLGCQYVQFLGDNYKIPRQIISKVDRITRLAVQVLDKHKDKFSTDFSQNKKILDQLAVIRSKGLKNEIAGYITKFIKRESFAKAKQQVESEPETEEVQAIEEQVEETPSEETAEEEPEQEVAVEAAESETEQAAEEEKTTETS